MPRTKEQFEELRKQKIQLIEKSALECFSKSGYYNTTINDIAKHAKISTGLTYNYFKSKEELLLAIFIKGLKVVFAPLVNIKQPLQKNEFIYFINHIFNELILNTPYWKMYFIVIAQPNILPKHKDELMNTVAFSMQSITNYFKSQKKSKPEIETKMFFSVVDGVCLNYISDTENFPLDEIKLKIITQYEQ